MTELIATPIRITTKHKKAIEAARRSEGFELSPWLREQLDRKFFGDPDFIQDQIESNDTLIHELTNLNKKLVQEKLDVIQRIVKRKERLEETKPIIRQYGTLEKKDEITRGKHGSLS